MAKKIKSTPVGPQEYMDFKIGDKVLCTRYPDGKLGYGSIHQIHLDTKSGEPCFSFKCEMCGAFRLAMFSDVVENPSQSQMNEVKKARLNLYPVKGKKRGKK